MKVIPYARQAISEEDIAAVADALRSDWLTTGPAVARFEEAVASYCGARHAAAVSNGTVALHLAYRALGLGPGDLLWTSPNTFVATANAALYCGAEVDFVDIDPKTYNMSVAALAEKLAAAERKRRLPKIVVPVHFAGQPCDLKEIAELARRYGFLVVEDAAHAIGAKYLDTAIGDCAYSDASVFSFHPVKIITTAEGGMVTVRSAKLHDELALLRSHGTTKDAGRMSGKPHGNWYYEQVDLGYNYRLTDVQAALGLSQIRRIEEFIAARHAMADRYDRALADLPLILPKRPSDRRSALHLYPVCVDKSRARLNRKQLYDGLHAAGIAVQVHYIPVHLQPFYARLGFREGDFPAAEDYYSSAVSLPLFPGLASDDQQRVIETLRRLLA